ncbi:MAG TPA: hypothetical protein VFB74_15145 [Kribbellaceae bacterium]|nr:hypothetical protein [Kribbellaceae bacterium]
MSEMRYAPIRLDTGRILTKYAFDDLAEARDQVDEAAFDIMLARNVDDRIPDPELAIVDLDNHDMAELDGDRPVWAWYDSFSGVWRHRLSTPGGAG